MLCIVTVLMKMGMCLLLKRDNCPVILKSYELFGISCSHTSHKVTLPLLFFKYYFFLVLCLDHIMLSFYTNLAGTKGKCRFDTLNLGTSRLHDKDENLHSSEHVNAGGATKEVPIDDASYSKLQGTDYKCAESPASETLSDIEDLEVDNYIHTAEEMQYKKIIWEELNREYVEEQLAKEAAAAAAKEACEAHMRNCPEDMEDARKLAAEVAAAMEQSKKERRQKSAAEAKNAAPPRTAAEATRQMLAKKKLDSKINYDVLDELFNDSVSPDNKKSRLNDEVYASGTEYVKQNMKENDSELLPENENEGGPEEFSEGLQYGNEEDYIDDYGYDEEY
ncbi:uncharacterized protein LOC135148319 isoform X2 [Daucus carota subsp. sativus]|uniref:uncharacterized protein LOC135148224 isoform X2 n=1 Tax=Daucus carota subsp. sativus TaxID=79200 RepID=UPI003083D991